MFISRAYPKAKYVGIHKFTSPTLLIRDLDVVHDVLIGKVSSFGQNEFFVNEKIDPLLAKSPFVQTGVQWKETRSMLTPIFTLARVKQLLPIVDESVRKLSSFIRAHSDTDLEAKNVGASIVRLPLRPPLFAEKLIVYFICSSVSNSPWRMWHLVLLA